MQLTPDLAENREKSDALYQHVNQKFRNENAFCLGSLKWNWKVELVT